MSKLFLDSLDNARLEVFNKLEKFADDGVLGGGTAIALQIGHRRSFDFDIFTQESLKQNIWRKVKFVLGENCYKTLDTPDQLNLITPQGVSVTFFYDDYPPLFEAIETSSINLMDLRDLAVNKARAIGKRGKWRDYVDLYFLLKGTNITLPEVMELSQKRCGGEFSPRLFLQQLTFFGDVEDYKIDYLNKPIDPEVIKEFLSKEVKLAAKLDGQ